MVSFSVLIILSHVSVCKPKVFCYRMLAYRREKLGRLGVLRPKTDLVSSVSISKLPEDWACFLPLRQFLGCLFHTWSSYTQFVILFLAVLTISPGNLFSRSLLSDASPALGSAFSCLPRTSSATTKTTCLLLLYLSPSSPPSPPSENPLLRRTTPHCPLSPPKDAKNTSPQPSNSLTTQNVSLPESVPSLNSSTWKMKPPSRVTTPPIITLHGQLSSHPHKLLQCKISSLGLSKSRTPPLTHLRVTGGGMLTKITPKTLT